MKRISEHNSQNSQNQAQKQPRPLVLALVLTGILTWEMYPALIDNPAANAGVLKHSLAKESQELLTVNQFPGARVLEKISYSRFGLNSLNSEPGNLAQSAGKNSPNELPPALEAALFDELSRLTGIPPARLKVAASSRQSWPNTCLGLASSDELCGQMIVEGWRVVVSDGRRTWVYRTDARGKVFRLEKKD
ncbi:MAG: hypothetical protein WCD53_07765 [Microcoleus sp.]